MKAEGPDKLNGHIALTSKLLYDLSTTGKQLVMHGRAPAHADPNYFDGNRYTKDKDWKPIRYQNAKGEKGMRFIAVAQAKSTDGQIKYTKNSIRFTGASELVLYISAATSFNGFDKDPDIEGFWPLCRQFAGDLE